MSAMKRLVFPAALLAAWLGVSAPSFGTPVDQKPAGAGSKPRAATSVRAVPTLVVILVVDQMRADYIDRYGDSWNAGFRRLMTQGAWFTRAAYPYAATVTCVGHSTIATGSLPPTHGIVGNSWYDRASGEVVPCAADPDTRLVRYGEGPDKAGSSARRLLVPNLADELRIQMARAPRVVTFSLKNYTASMMAGQRPDAATWFDGDSGQWVTSTAFTPSPVPWLSRVVHQRRIEAAIGDTWLRLLAPGQYQHEDDGKGEKGVAQWTASFPHPLAGTPGQADAAFYEAWAGSPFSDAYLAQLGISAIDELKLGQGEGTDYLAISFSALDMVGHDFGPRSHEVQDVLARLDRSVGQLIAHLDRRVPGRYVLALTADHGVAPIPEQTAAQGVPAGRVPAADLAGRVEKVLGGLFGPGKQVARTVGNEVIFAPGVLDKLRANPAAVRALKDAVREVPGVAGAYLGDELENLPANTENRLARAAAAGYYPGRSGDLIVFLRPYWLFGSGTTGTSHGSPYGYDQRVALFLMGQGIKAGRFAGDAGPMDIAPTLAHLVGVTLASADGRVLTEALR
jgi:predicted AlkP superfamily pyrophosphatase or phosphodiesterase